MSHRPGKGKAMTFPSDFIALGAKSGPSGSSKREGTPVGSSSGAPFTKKPKVASALSTISATRPAKTNDKSNVWETLAVEVDNCDFSAAVQDAEDSQDAERVEALLCGAVKALRNQRAKPDNPLYLSVMYLSKMNPALFSASEFVLQAFCSLLKRDVKENYKSKGNVLVPVLAANVLMAAFETDRNWPEIFVRVFIDDAMGERVWVDNAECKGFVDNILTAFGTKLPTQTPLGLGGPKDSCSSPPVAGGSGSGSGSATPTRMDEDSLPETLPLNMEEYDITVVRRYNGLQNVIEDIVMEIVREQLNRRQGTDNITRNFLKFLTQASGLAEVRRIVVPKLEMWIMNPKVSRPAQDLLMAVAMNCNTQSPIDIEVIGNFTKLRFKNKPTINWYLQALRELCLAHRDNLPSSLKYTIFNELSNARNTNNMSMLTVMFQTEPERASASLAAVFIELLLQKECYLRALRALLREIVRALRYDINLHAFCGHLMTDRPKPEAAFRDFEFKERMFTSITDLITLAIFLGISPSVRESITAYHRAEKKDTTPYKNYLKTIALIQRDAVWWFYEVVPKIYKPEPTAYPPNLHKVLFMVPLDEYCHTDGWPAEADRVLFFKATSEIPLLQDTLLRIFLIGMNKNLPLNGRDTIDLVDCIIKRAAALHHLESEDFPILEADKASEFFEFLFQLAAYNYHENISLPNDYTPPRMAISNCYWKVWVILVMISAHNPLSFGAVAWENYPTLRACMEMCITNQFVFPPPTIATGEQAEDMKAKELQTQTLEKQAILDFEMHLAAATNKTVITESNSFLLAQLITMDPGGLFRKPPQQVLDQLQNYNQHYKIGHLLCRSRNPDFLLDILQRQGTNTAMPWLADLVESSEGSFNVLPVQCLCEFLLNSNMAAAAEETNDDSSKKRKQRQLLLHLQNLLQNPNSNPQACCETLDYFLRRLSSQQTNARLQALRGLRMVLTPIDAMQTDENDWLLDHMPKLPCYELFFAQISAALRSACQVENDPDTVSLYIQFLCSTPTENITDLTELCLDLATIIVERSTLLPAILPGGLCKATNPIETFQSLLKLFTRYMLKIKNSNIRWTDPQDMITVVWPSKRDTAVIHYFVVHAQIILLTFGPQDDHVLFETLLSIWHPMPQAYWVESQEPAPLIPDWLKLKMIRSDVAVLVDNALRELEPHQLVLFIQSFGIPVASMSKLLQHLDRAVQANIEAVHEAVMDKTYMGQLVAVQHQRGANGGEHFAEALGLNIHVHKQQFSGGPLRDPGPPMPPLQCPSIPPRSTAMIPPGQVKSTLLHLFDVGSPSGVTMEEKQDTFRTLQKYLTTEIRSGASAPIKPILEATVKAFDTILGSDLSESFAVALNQRTAFSCGLFRLISMAVSKPEMAAMNTALIRVTRKLQSLLEKKSIKSGPLCSLLEGYLKKAKPVSPRKKGGRAVKAEIKTEEGTLGATITAQDFEKNVQGLVQSALKRHDTAPLIGKMSNMLLSEQEATSKEESPPVSAKVGLLVDWLEMLDPEIVQACPDIQQQLLFSKKIGPNKGKTSNCRPYLLTMLTHQASWKSLRRTIDVVMGTFNPEMDPSAVLDFLCACVYIPRLWHGRDKHVPKHETQQDVLSLTGPQLYVLMDYCLQEHAETGAETASRMPLILRCLPDNSRARTVVDYLIDKLAATDVKRENGDETVRPTKDHVREWLLQIYMKLPKCVLHMTEFQLPGLASCSSGRYTSTLDALSHTLLTALSATQHGRQWGIQMQEFEASTRKVASCHPHLMLRNLPLIASSLKGRTQYEFSFFRSRNHMTLYTILLGVMELLQPHIFKPEHKSALQDALKCYFEMIAAYFNRRDSIRGLIDKFILFLHEYMDHQPSDAVLFIRQHGQMLPDLHKAMPNITSLKQLVGAVSFSKSTSESSLPYCGLVNERNAAASIEAGRLMTSLQKAGDNPDEVAAVLSDLVNSSVSKPGILVRFVDEITYYISHPHRQVRHHAYTVLLKFLRHSPKSSQLIVPAFIECLESADNAVVQSALDKLPDIAVLAQESLSRILQTAFGLGLYSNFAGVSTAIVDTINLLNTQAGY